MFPVIDTHTHFVPATLPDGAGHPARWPAMEHHSDGRAALLIDGKPFRVLEPANWDAAARLAEMIVQGTDEQVISPMPELLSHWLDAGEADHLSRHVNQALAILVAAAPGHFHGLGMVPMQDPELAARRLEEVRDLGLCGVEIGTHIDGKPLSDPSLNPFWAAAEALNLAIMVHPLHPAGRERLPAHPALAAAAAFPADMALAGTALLSAGIPVRFPALRVLLCHGGGALPWILPRLDRIWDLGGTLGGAFPAKPSDMARHFYYDSVLYDDRTLRFLADSVGRNRVLVGSDYPFVIQQDQPGAFTDHALGGARQTLYRNALAFLGKA